MLEEIRQIDFCLPPLVVYMSRGGEKESIASKFHRGFNSGPLIYGITTGCGGPSSFGAGLGSSCHRPLLVSVLFSLWHQSGGSHEYWLAEEQGLFFRCFSVNFYLLLNPWLNIPAFLKNVIPS